MCVIFFYVNANPACGGYKLILASNRDEFYQRPTQPALKWSQNHNIYGGIDKETDRVGGTWLAVAGKHGIVRVGALLNLTGEPKKPYAPGRGFITTDFVTSNETTSHIDQYNELLLDTCSKYNAFNFLSIEIGSPDIPAKIRMCNNVEPKLQSYEQGKSYGFGNSLPHTPFEKVRHGRKRFEEIVDNFHSNGTERSQLVAELHSLLKCPQRHWPDSELQRRAPNKGEELSSLYVTIPSLNYGSRTHTIILIDANDCLHYYESTMKSFDPETWEDNYFQHENFSQDL